MRLFSHFVHQVGAVFYDTTRALAERRVAHATPQYVEQRGQG